MFPFTNHSSFSSAAAFTRSESAAVVWAFLAPFAAAVLPLTVHEQHRPAGWLVGFIAAVAVIPAPFSLAAAPLMARFDGSVFRAARTDVVVRAAVLANAVGFALLAMGVALGSL